MGVDELRVLLHETVEVGFEVGQDLAELVDFGLLFADDPVLHFLVHHRELVERLRELRQRAGVSALQNGLRVSPGLTLCFWRMLVEYCFTWS